MAFRRTLYALIAASALSLGGVALAASPANGGRVPAIELTVADFDSGRKPNNIGGDFGAWIADPDDPMQGAIESFDRTNRYGGKGYALRLIYSVESSNPAYGGLWMRLRELDTRPFDNLSFRIRGDASMGYTSVLKVELKDALDQASHHYVRGITDQWQEVVIPLEDFQGMTNFAKLKEFVLVIEDSNATARRGVLYLDDVRFTK